MLQDNTTQVVNHAARHQNSGADEIDVTGLSGLLDDAQTPLAHNQLEYLPKEIGDLSNLQKLDLNHNLLKELPKEIGRLSNLQEMNLILPYPAPGQTLGGDVETNFHFKF